MITEEMMSILFPLKGRYAASRTLASPAARTAVVAALNRYLPKYGIDTYLRVCGFLGCSGKETDYYRTTVEYGGLAYFKKYERPTDIARKLGNTEKGDGARFRGRGLFQTTGRSNYTIFNATVGAALKVNLVTHPERLAEIDLAAESACFYWKWADLNQWADVREWKKLNARVNTGNPRATPSHWAERKAITEHALRVVPQGILFPCFAS